MAGGIGFPGRPFPGSSRGGGAERLREEIGSPLSPSERLPYDQQVAAARVALKDDAAFAAAWAEGRAMTLEQAIAYALEQRPG